MLTTPKGIRRNNPLNLMATHPRQGWLGSAPDEAFDGDREEAFIAPYFGLRAGAMVLLHEEVRLGLWTVRQIFTRFAPPVENDTEAYIRDMAGWLNVDPDQPIDLREPDRLAEALKGATRQENGEVPYPEPLFYAAAHAALSGRSPYRTPLPTERA